jgi:N-acetylglucosamine kinase-like BadF-type ATPase
MPAMATEKGARLAIDGGGTHVRAAFFDGSIEVARRTAGPANPARVGVAAAEEALREVLTALVAAEPRAAKVAAAAAGLAGRSHPDVATIMKNAFAAAGVDVAGAKILTTDADLVLWAAFGATAPSGVVVVAGTGSGAMARGRDGAPVRAGGYGPVLGDEGGGHWIGVEALKIALLKLEEAGRGGRSRPSILVDDLHGAIEGSLASAPAAIARGKLRPSTLAPTVVRSAERGDPDANEVLKRAGVELASLACRAAIAASLEGPFDVRCAGGVFAGAARVVASMRAELKAKRPEASLGEHVVDPIEGAVALLDHVAATSKSRVPVDW